MRTVEIKDKVALVTGANRGIGRAIVESFIKHGAHKVYLAVRDLSSTDELVKQYGNKVVPLKVDITDKSAVDLLSEKAGDVDIVVNNAGLLSVSNPLDSNFKDAFLKEIEVNVFGLINVAQAFTTTLARKKGAFVQLNSVASLVIMTPISSYSASKAASYSITQGLKNLLNEQGIHVLSVHPGATDTNMLKNINFAGFAEPVEVVSEGIVQALKNGEFLLFPGQESRQIGSQYQSFAKNVITSEEN